MSTPEFKQYRRKQIAELADWYPGFDMTGVSISDADKATGSPKLGDKIARNPVNHADRWLVAADYFSVNFEAADALSAQPDVEAVIEACANVCDELENRKRTDYMHQCLTDTSPSACATLIRSLDRSQFNAPSPDASGSPPETSGQAVMAPAMGEGHQKAAAQDTGKPQISPMGTAPVSDPASAAPHHLSEVEQRALKRALVKSSTPVAAAPIDDLALPEEPRSFAAFNELQQLLTPHAVRYTHYAALLSLARRLKERLAEAERRELEWRKALMSLTAGGSEFTTPEACVEYVRRVRESQHEAIIKFKRERDEAEQRAWKDSGGWISVKERLPEQPRTYGDLSLNKDRWYVLAADAKGRMSIGYCMRYSSGENNWVFAKNIGEPTHWMPLPAAPSATPSAQGEKEGKETK